MIPHLAEVVEGGLNSGQKRDLQIKQIHLVCVVKDLELVHVVKSVSKGLSDMLFHKPPQVLDSAVLSGLTLTTITDAVSTYLCLSLGNHRDTKTVAVMRLIQGVDVRDVILSRMGQNYTDMAEPRLKVDTSFGS